MQNKSAGMASRVLIIFAAVAIFLIVIVFLAMRFASRGPKQDVVAPENQEPPPKIYETTIGDVRFLFESAQNMGKTLTSSIPSQPVLSTTEKFIKVIIRAQNKGKKDLNRYTWDVGNIVDSEGRNFIPSMEAYYFLPRPDLCGAVLKPEFEPIPCVKIYEVSKASTNLQVEVSITDQNGKRQSDILDLLVK